MITHWQFPRPVCLLYWPKGIITRVSFKSLKMAPISMIFLGIHFFKLYIISMFLSVWLDKILRTNTKCNKLPSKQNSTSVSETPFTLPSSHYQPQGWTLASFLTICLYNLSEKNNVVFTPLCLFHLLNIYLWDSFLSLCVDIQIVHFHTHVV